MQRTTSQKSQTSNRSNDALSEEELAFIWKGLVENGQLSAAKLKLFMKNVAGIQLSNTQSRDLLMYMDANGDGRVGMEDFKNFMSIIHLSDTDAKTFMWEPKKKYQEENPYHKVAHLHDHAHYAWDGESRERRGSDADHPEKLLAGPVTPSEPKPAHKAPRPRARQSIMHAATLNPSEPADFEPSHGSSKPDSARHDRSHHDAGASPGKPKKEKPPPLTPEAEKKIELALLRYEQQQWDRLTTIEKQAKRQLFEQFAGQGGDELNPTEYHKMLIRWIQSASWCAPWGLKPADSLAALEYVTRKDMEDRGLVPKAVSSPDGENRDAAAASLASEAPACMSYGVWLDVVNGKHLPEEHLTSAPKEVHPSTSAGDGPELTTSHA